MNPSFTRREMIRGSVAFAAVALTHAPWSALGARAREDAGTLIPFLDKQPPGKMLQWENLTDWITPNDQVFAVSHYGKPVVDPAQFKLEVGGLVRKPITLSLEQIRKRRRKSVVATLECSGNSSNPGFAGAIGNVRWTGTPLVSLLDDCQPLKRGIEVVFFGADEKVEKIREKEYSQNFARSLSIREAARDEILLAYEMNGEPLTPEHGAPLRLVVPGWFGIAWVKWLQRIEVLDRRYMSKYMAREYVTIRGEERNGKTIWRETSVGPIDVKSVTARAARLSDGTIRFSGAAWTDGTPLRRVEIKIGESAWKPVDLARKPSERYGWRFWTYDWKHPESGDHTVVSRAIDTEGRIQPSYEDPEIKLKRTYWEANQQFPRKLRV